MYCGRTLSRTLFSLMEKIDKQRQSKQVDMTFKVAWFIVIPFRIFNVIVSKYDPRFKFYNFVFILLILTTILLMKCEMFRAKLKMHITLFHHHMFQNMCNHYHISVGKVWVYWIYLNLNKSSILKLDHHFAR